MPVVNSGNGYDYADHRQAAAHFAALSERVSEAMMKLAYARIAQGYARLADMYDRLARLNGELRAGMRPPLQPAGRMVPLRNHLPGSRNHLASRGELSSRADHEQRAEMGVAGPIGR
jgi:hypothetical protein